MKKFLIILVVIVVVLVGAAILLPIIFKDDIKLVIQGAVEKNLKATVYFDESKISVTLFKSFPDLTVTLRDFGVVGVEHFVNDTLFSTSQFDLTVDIKSVISGNTINLKSINLINPRILVLVNEEGKANYDIMIESEETEEAPVEEETGEEMKIGIQQWSITNGNIVYFDQTMNFLLALKGLNHQGTGDFTTTVFDMDTHSEAEALLMSYDGTDYLNNQKLVADVVMNMDLNTFTFTFKENSARLNDFGLKFDGFFAMPERGYQMDIKFKSEENTFKSLFSLIPAAYMEGYENIKADGTFTFEGFVKGTYDDSLGTMPAFQVALKTENGRIQYPDLPEVINNVNVDFFVDNPDGVIENTLVDLKKFHMDFGQNPVDATLRVENLRDYKMKADIKARFNLGDITKMVPLDSTTITGMLDASLSIDGVYDSVKHIIPAQGSMALKNFAFSSPDLPQGMSIGSTRVDINTSRVVVDHFNGSIGKSDLSLKGYVSNYVDYIFSEGAKLYGQLDFNSNVFDLNEWMTEDTTEVETTEDTTTYEIVQIPDNIDFVLNSSIGKMLYTNLEMTDFRGMLIVRDGVLRISDAGFKTLGGQFTMSGAYDTRDMENPLFDFDFSIKDLSIPVAYQNFNTVQKLAPVAAIMDGRFSTNFKMNGKLMKDYSPDYNSLAGNGILNIAQAAVKGSESKLVSGINSVAKVGNESGDITLKDVVMKAEIINGRVYLEPFNVKIGQNNALIAGSNGIDGSLDYKIKMDVPAAAVSTVTSLVASSTGQKLNLDPSNVKLNLGVTGNYDDPKVKLLGAESGSSSAGAKEALKATVSAEKEKVVNEAEKVAEEKKEEVMKEVEEVKKEQQENVNKEVDKAKDKLKKMFKGGK